MAGGKACQAAPTEKWATTAPFGTIDRPFNISSLVTAAGASFVARETVNNPRALQRLIKRALQVEGFSLVEVMTPCPTNYGRKNKQKTPVLMMHKLKENSINIKKVDSPHVKLEDDEQFVTGVFVDRDQPEYVAEYLKIVESVSNEGK